MPKCIGNAADSPIVPMERPTLRFDGNTAHSSGWYWYIFPFPGFSILYHILF